MMDKSKIRGIIDNKKTEFESTVNTSKLLTPQTVHHTARRLNMSLSQKRGTNQASRSGIGFGCQTTRQRYYVKIAEWVLKQPNVQAALKDRHLSSVDKAVYAYMTWYCHNNKTQRVSEDAIASRHREISKLMEAMEVVLGCDLGEVA